MQTAIKVDHLTRTFGKGTNQFTALKDINFTIKAGESVAIVGKSGSGKSTLMHQLALLDTPTSGQIFITDKPSAGLPQRELDRIRNQQFGFVFQQFFLNGNDSVINNVALPLKVAGVRESQRRERAHEALAQVELDDKADVRARDLSGGQKQRVCIARALINRPEVIFADEPTGNLDSATGEKVADLLFELNRTKGITLILVTHDLDLARRCNRQIRIKDGQLMEVK